MTSGDVLSQWLQRQHGSVVQGSLVSLSRGGLLRVSDAQSRPVRVVLPVVHGGQAAVARAVDQAGESLALRVQAVASDAEKARQMERLVNMTTVAQVARDQPGRFPAVLPVLESFVLVVPGADVPVTAPEPEYELWCDLMAWCPHDLNGWSKSVPVASRQPGEVLGAFLPLLATVQAVHQDLGIVHRDITPNNVLVDERGRLLLADWGIAHGLAAGQTSTYTQLVGNRGFSLPPEMLAGDPSVGRYTDAWYLGSLLAWMLTGQPPGPQHGPGWLPPGLPGEAVGDQVATVVRGLCRLDPHGRMDLAQAHTVLTDAAAGRLSPHLTEPLAASAAGPGGAGPESPGATVPDPAPDPVPDPASVATSRLPDGQTLAAPAYGTPPYAPGPTSPRPRSGTTTDAPEEDDGRSAAWIWTGVAVVVVVVVVAFALWTSRLLSDDASPPGASPTSSRASSAASTPSATEPEEAGAAAPPTGEAAVPSGETGPLYSAERSRQIIDDLYEATGGTQFTNVAFYEGFVYATAPTTPGASTFDDFTWRDGKVTHSVALAQPKAEKLFDATTVDWSQAETLVNRLPELSGVDNPDEFFVFVYRAPGGALQFRVSTRDAYYSPWILADPSGNITQMGGGHPGTPAAG